MRGDRKRLLACLTGRTKLHKWGPPNRYRSVRMQRKAHYRDPYPAET